MNNPDFWLAILGIVLVAVVFLTLTWSWESSRSSRRSGEKCCNSKKESLLMPTVQSRVVGDTPAAPAAGYPKLMKGNQSGSIYLLTAPKTGVVVHLGANPWRGRKSSTSKHRVGYASSKFKEADMTPFKGEVSLKFA